MNEKGRKRTLSDLKAFAENGLWGPSHLGDVIVEESDRGAITILVSVLDDVLAAAIERKLRPLNTDDRARLFGFDAPLGSFSARIKMAYAMEIIDDEDRDDLDVLRSMRNAAAHARGGLSFADEALRGALALLFSDGEVRAHIRSGASLQILGKIHFVAIIRYLMAKINGFSNDDAAKQSDEIYDLLSREIDEARKEGDAAP